MRNNHKSACPKGTLAGYNTLNDTLFSNCEIYLHLKSILLMKLVRQRK